MFDELFNDRKDKNNRTKYACNLGWKEPDQDGDMVSAAIFVYDINIGYAVFRQGGDPSPRLIYHSLDLGKTVEWAVDRARQEIADHEIKQVEKAKAHDAS